jgi:hypothetical protein
MNLIDIACKSRKSSPIALVWAICAAAAHQKVLSLPLR